MQKKVMAVAVAAALAAPAAALAQGSSVQIYGGLSVSVEGAEATGADTSFGAGRRRQLDPRRQHRRRRVFHHQRQRAVAHPHAGRGLERRRSRARGSRQRALHGLPGRAVDRDGRRDARKAPAATACKAAWRNSGVWLGGRWGEVGLGLWDLPFNMNQTLGAAHAPYANASTSMSAGLLGGGLGSTAAGTSSGQDIGQFCGASALGAVGDDLLPERVQLPSPPEQLGLVSVADLGWIPWPRRVRRDRRRDRQCEQRRRAVPG